MANFEKNKSLIIYEKSNDLIINHSDLKVELIHFKNAVENGSFFVNIVGVAGVWVPIVTAQFQPIMELSSDSVKGAYFLFACFVTYFYTRKIGLLIILNIFNFSPNYSKFCKFIDQYENDPERRSQLIVNKCLKK